MLAQIDNSWSYRTFWLLPHVLCSLVLSALCFR